MDKINKKTEVELISGKDKKIRFKDFQAQPIEEEAGYQYLSGFFQRLHV